MTVVRRKPPWRLSVSIALDSGETYNAATTIRARDLAEILDSDDGFTEQLFSGLGEGVEARLEGILQDHPEQVTKLGFSVERVKR